MATPKEQGMAHFKNSIKGTVELSEGILLEYAGDAIDVALKAANKKK